MAASMFFYLILFFLSICIHTHVEVALHPALLLHGMNGNKLSAQTPAHTPISELIPVRPGASHRKNEGRVLLNVGVREAKSTVIARLSVLGKNSFDCTAPCKTDKIISIFSY
uniref:Uncharacterized protein n=1 Tax=Poecilia latipinna TaxID=48699 RepID=A0A3B3UAX5_9TELE